MKQNKLRDLFGQSEFQVEYPLAHELPFWDFLGQEDGNCVALADGSLVQGLKLTGISVETMDADGVNQLTGSIRSVLNSVPDGVELQFILDVNSDYSEMIEAHETLKGTDSLISWVAESRIGALKDDVRNQRLQKPNLYLFIYQRVKSVSGSLGSFFEKPTHFARMRKEEHEKRSHELSQLAASISANLAGAGIGAAMLDSSLVIELVYRVLNPTRSQSFDAPKLSSVHRQQEFSAEELKHAPELAEPSPREQLTFSDVIQGLDSFYLDGFHYRVITLKTLPEFTHSALVGKLTSLPFHFLFSTQVKVPEQSKELSSLQAKRRMAHSMNANNGGRASDLESEAKLHSTEELLRELINTGQKIYYFQAAILLKAKSRDDLELQTKTVLSRFREMNGAEGLAETVAGFKVFKTLLPAGNSVMVRPKRVKTDNLADFIPLYQPWEGDGKPVCLFRNRMAGLVAYNPFDPKLPNYNCLVTGSSGAGKSFLNNCILLQYLTQKPLIYIIDIGGSYRKLCEFMGGQYIELTPPTESGSSQTINPFLLPLNSTEPSPQKIKFLIALLESVLTDEEGDKLRKLDKSLLEEAIMETYSRCLPSRMPKLSDFAQTLESSKGANSEALKNFAKMLYPWTGSRPYGRLLDAENGLDLNADMVVFDLKGLSSYPDLQSAMILIITDFILGRVEGIAGRRKQILMDECWELLKSRGASQFMEYCARTLRKTGSGITFITQGLEEIERSAIGPAILNNTATKFILLQRGDLEPIRKTLKLNEQEMALISSLRQQKGSYSEAFLMANEKRIVIRVAPTPVEYWLATSDAADNALLAQVRERMPDKNLPENIHWLATHYPKGSQGATEVKEAA